MLRQALEAYSSSPSPVRVHSSSRSPVRRSSGVWAGNEAASSPEQFECSDEHENEQGVIVLGVCALNKKANCRAMTDMLQVRTWLVTAKQHHLEVALLHHCRVDIAMHCPFDRVRLYSAQSF
jgi:hypothetical protein